MSATEIVDRIRRKCGGRVIVELFDSRLWQDRVAVLSSVGLRPSPTGAWFEVDRHDAEELLVSALSRDLCYGSKVMSPSDARSLVAPFLELMHFQTRFFTNSEIPYHRREPNSWAYHGISSATIDTGVACELAKQFTGVLWVADCD